MRNGTVSLLRYPDSGSTVVGRNVSSVHRNSGMSDGKSELRSFEIPRISLNVRKKLNSPQITAKTLQ